MAKKTVQINSARSIRSGEKRARLMKMHKRKKGGFDLTKMVNKEMKNYEEIKNMMKMFSEKTVFEQKKMIEEKVLPYLKETDLGSSLIVHYEELLLWLDRISDLSYIKETNINDYLSEDGDVDKNKLAALITTFRDKLKKHDKYTFVDPSIVTNKNKMRKVEYKDYLKFLTTVYVYMNSIHINKNSSYFINKLILKLVTVTDDVLSLIEAIEGVDLTEMKMTDDERVIIDKYFEDVDIVGAEVSDTAEQVDVDENAFDEDGPETSIETPKKIDGGSDER